MARYFSKSTGGFYDSAIHGAKSAKGSLVPRDAAAVTDDEHAALMAEQAGGKRILATTSGAPIALDPEARRPRLSPRSARAATASSPPPITPSLATR